jgi:NAD(P)H-hydrate epimerase
VRWDFDEIGGFPAEGRVLVLVGKGHNGGDALIATQAILERFPAARAEVVFVFGERKLRPLAARAWRELVHVGGARVTTGRPGAVALPEVDLCLDGIFGFQFRPPVEERVAALIEAVNGRAIRLRAAVDLPSAGRFRADFTYATGIVKRPLFAESAAQAGRVRYLDLGFFRAGEAGVARVLTPAVLAPLAGLRDSRSDKRTYGHVLVVAGSHRFPGAALMTVLAALQSGAGLVTAFVPETLVPAFAARAPEAMWVGWPETPGGGLALEGQHLLAAKIDRASALVIGPGLGEEAETLALVKDLVATATVPLVLDADALRPDIVRAGTAARILTPHAGELARIGEIGQTKARVVTVAKGAVTRISGGEDGADYYSFFGGPVLARGGSGDLLAGITGGAARADAGRAVAGGVPRGGVARDGGGCAGANARADGRADDAAARLSRGGVARVAAGDP